MEYVLQSFLLILGFVMLWKGADWFVDGASAIATKFKIPQIVIGLTIVALGTSAPEATVSIISSIKGKADLAVGNVFGSNILNILIILGISALVFPLAVKKGTVFIEIPYIILTTFALVVMGADGKIGRLDGLVLLILLVIYITYLFLETKNNKPEELSADLQEKKVKPIWLSILLTIVGLAIIIAGSQFTINSATFFAQKIGLSDRFIGLTVVALGTSLPELFTSVIASAKKNPDIAIGNVVGSNILNVIFVLGVASSISPLNYSAAFNIDAIFALLAPLLLFIFVLPKNKLPRWAGALMLLTYVAYFFVIW